ncbi:Protein of unknown function DUF3179 [Desulfovibrio sp. X2]|uniref:DUF3179 domain-containing (seleno)protein n=1 Tax=Desulfovibrio sp. X2 TaxID=941449 RepID=UPI000358B112|nr:DUF3179 domain-containing (seleno)protein [Desulfovibrio sp. X2]EPR42818.1 Protein of unknown function DUF3179 [Desulfovibrio sp. X2]
MLPFLPGLLTALLCLALALPAASARAETAAKDEAGKDGGSYMGIWTMRQGSSECRLPVVKTLAEGEPCAESLAIADPRFVPAREASLPGDEEVFGVRMEGFTAAFPMRIMAWHEVANFLADGEKRSLTYCPYADSAVGFSGCTLVPSGQVSESNLVLTDRETKSRFVQMDGVAFSGPRTGEKPATFPVTRTTWARWLAANPATLVLVPPDGTGWDYDSAPFQAYGDSAALIFPVSTHGGPLGPKDRVLVVQNGEKRVAAEIKDFDLRHPQGLDLTLDARPVRVARDTASGDLAVDGATSFEADWFAVKARWPGISLIR